MIVHLRLDPLPSQQTTPPDERRGDDFPHAIYLYLYRDSFHARRGMLPTTLCVLHDAERPRWYSHAERGNEFRHLYKYEYLLMIQKREPGQKPDTFQLMPLGVEG